MTHYLPGMLAIRLYDQCMEATETSVYALLHLILLWYNKLKGFFHTLKT